MPIKISPAGTTLDGRSVFQATLSNNHGLTLRAISYGGIVTHLFAPDRDGRPGDVVLGADSAIEYQQTNFYIGAICGRVANRIADGRFALDGRTYTLATNDPPNHLHGGVSGFDQRIWAFEPSGTSEEPTLRLRLTDPAGNEGYPGTLNVLAQYTLTRDNEWRIEFEAETDAPTPVNLTQHAYFNLRDAGATPITDHILRMHATHYTVKNSRNVPTGELAPIADSPLDFRQPKPIGLDIGKLELGYDHNFVIEGPPDSLRPAAELYDPSSGRLLEMSTSVPGVQVYTGYYLDGRFHGKSSTRYQRYTGVCLEAQHFPDSVNHSNFPNTILRPGERYRHTTVYRFSSR